MKQLHPRTRALFDALRDDDELAPGQVEHAWRRFSRAAGPASRRGSPRGRHERTRWIAITTGAAALGTALIVAAVWSRSIARPEPTGAEPQEASAHADGPTPREATTREPWSRGAEASPDASPGPGKPREPSSPSPHADRDPMKTPHVRPRARPDREPRSVPSTLAAELRLLDEAERALRGGRLDRVETLLELHRERHPEGLLVQERDKLADELARQRGIER